MSTDRSIITHHRSHRELIITLIRQRSIHLSCPRRQSWTVFPLTRPASSRTNLERVANKENRDDVSNDTLDREIENENERERERKSTPTLPPDEIDPCLQTGHARSPILRGRGYEIIPVGVSHPFGRQIPWPSDPCRPGCVAGFPIYPGR